MKCLRTRSESLKKCFLLCETLLLSFLVGCSGEPVYIADEIDCSELWNFTEATVPVESFDAFGTLEETKEPPHGDGTVYYTVSGSVWHISPDCSSLKRSKKVLSGTVEQAIEDGMERACKRCGG